jgi:hypothetical protein
MLEHAKVNIRHSLRLWTPKLLFSVIRKIHFYFSGPELPSKAITYHMITSSSGNGVLVMGGYRDRVYSKQIHELTCPSSSNQCQWDLLAQKLPRGRNNFVAFYGTKDITTCV